MADHARQRQPGVGARAVIVVAVVPVGVGVDGLPPHFAQGDEHRRVARGRGERQRRAHALRVTDRPLQDLHPAHAAAGQTPSSLSMPR